MRDEFLPFGKPDFGPLEEQAVLRVMRSGWVGMGPETIAFEQELADYLGVPHVVTVNSCTSALQLSLLVQGIGPGDEVIVPSMTWCSTANVALYLGATPVFCDVDPDTMCATWETISPHITAKTRAVIVVHYGGLVADVQQIRRHLPPGVVLIEDAAHALGAAHPGGAMVGSLGNLTCFSFYANKNLSTGEGGAVALHDADLAEQIKSLRLHALSSDAWKRYQNKQSFDMGLTTLGYKMNWTDLQACIGRVQLRRQPEFQARRQAIVERYQEALPAILPGIRWQAGLGSGPQHAAHLFVVQLPLESLRVSRDDVFLAMKAQNIGAAIHYAPLHLMPLYSKQRVQPSLPIAEALEKRILTLPISASMTLADCEDVLATFKSVVSVNRASQVYA